LLFAFQLKKNTSEDITAERTAWGDFSFLVNEALCKTKERSEEFFLFDVDFFFFALSLAPFFSITSFPFFSLLSHPSFSPQEKNYLNHAAGPGPGDRPEEAPPRRGVGRRPRLGRGRRPRQARRLEGRRVQARRELRQ
jgi:hypothetical protein